MATCAPPEGPRATLRTFAASPEAIRNSPRCATIISDPSTIKLNHAIHLKPIRRGPTGPTVHLDCADCHRPAAAKTSWTYADANYLTGRMLRIRRTKDRCARNESPLAPHTPSTGRELMAPVTFANSCASCHLLLSTNVSAKASRTTNPKLFARSSRETSRSTRPRIRRSCVRLATLTGI